jgi:hypothetical protein
MDFLLKFKEQQIFVLQPIKYAKLSSLIREFSLCWVNLLRLLHGVFSFSSPKAGDGFTRPSRPRQGKSGHVENWLFTAHEVAWQKV